MAKKKRKATASQLRNLAKGRKKLKAKRKSKRPAAKHKRPAKKVHRKKVVHHKKKSIALYEGLEPITVSGGKKKMVKHRKHHKKAIHHRGRYLHGGVSARGAGDVLKNGAVAIAGGFAASFAANALPVSANWKPAIPILAGLGISMTKLKHDPILKAAGLGMIVVGGISLIKKFTKVPLLAGESTTIELTPEQAAMLGREVDMLGAPVSSFAGEESSNFQTTADIG